MTTNIITIDPVSIICTIFNVLLMYWILRKFLIKPVNRILEQRAKMIQDEKDNADQLNKEAEAFKKEYDEKLAGIEAQRDFTIKDATRKASVEYDRIVAEAHTQAEEIISDAQHKAILEQKHRRAESQRELADLVTAATAKIAAGQSGSELDSELYDNFLSKAGGDEDEQ